jgi:hypothetical protein
MRDSWVFWGQVACILARALLRVILVLLWLWLTGSFCFDIIHYLLHRWSKSNSRLLSRLGDLHMVHHYYFNRKLKFNYRYYWHNICIELPLELSCQLFGTWLGSLAVKWVPWKIMGELPTLEGNKRDLKALNVIASTTTSKNLLFIVVMVEIIRTLVVIILSGRDSNHKTYERVPKDPSWLVVGPEYHAHHHIQPTAYISSTFRLFDWLLGTGNSLKSRRITLTGSSGAFGKAMRTELENEGVKKIKTLKYGIDWKYDNYDSAIAILAETDILILAHGSKHNDALEANCKSVLKLISIFKEHRKPGTGYNSMLLPEVWYVGSEIEFYPSWGGSQLHLPYAHSKRSFLSHARSLHDDTSINYRHIVPSAFASSMGSAMVSAGWAARGALWWIRRGARYVPVTYTGIAYLHYFKYMYCIEKS